jgi:protein kinase-like protein
MDLRQGQTIGGWSLQDFLGEGGNAEVWRASRGDEIAAVKFLKTRRVDSTAWARFVDEVKFVRSLGQQSGVLPVLDYFLPEEGPAKGERAWYSMPIAVPLVAALADAPLATVVDAVHEVAETLAEIFEQHQAAHRDIKPGNLYVYGGYYSIGDWGLLWHEEITGPLSFTAPELFRALNEGEVIDYQASDVFSLAKTLWALARGSQWALPGQHQLDDAVGAFRIHSRSATLDRLLARSTDPDPTDRPTMREFARELDAWRRLSPEPGPTPSLADIGELLQDGFAPLDELEQGLRNASTHFNTLVEYANDRLRPFYSELESSIPRVRVGIHDGVTLNMLMGHEYLGSPGKLHQYGTAACLSDQAQTLELVLEMGLLIETWDNDTTRVGAAIFLGRVEELGGGGGDSHGPAEIATGTVAETQTVDDAIAWLAAEAPAWLRRFAQVVAGDS